MKAKKVSDSQTIMSEIVMPNDTNPLHNLMGGNLMRWMDIAAGICAGKHCESHVVTASVDHVSFQRSVPLGDVVTIKAAVTRSFNTSVEIYVEVFADALVGGNARRCNHAYFTFVAVERATMKPCPVPPVLPLTNEEQNQFDAAKRRSELRLILSGRMKPTDAAEIRSIFLGADEKK
jgi:acyl-CoA hydrolase